MRLLLQRVTDASVSVEGDVIGEIGLGLLVLVGFGREDGPELPETPVWRKLLDKTLNLRVFPDAGGRLNRSLLDIRGDLLLVSQFTLYADCRKGRRPSFTDACPPEVARPLFDRLTADAGVLAPGRVATGRFGAEMRLAFTNWGPVTILLDSRRM